jgi:catechol 2,3-dioxygenase-like lactoylglutathione lyase family enzyme
LLHHVEIYVADLKISAEFWGWFLGELGYVKCQEWPEGVSWKFGETYLVFVQAEERFLAVPYHRCRAGLNHLAFHGGSRERVDWFTEQVRARGMTILYPERHPYAGGAGSYALFFEGPERMKVEVVGELEKLKS